MDVMLRFCICLLAPMAYALDNGAAPTPPLGWQVMHLYSTSFPFLNNISIASEMYCGISHGNGRHS